MEWVALTHPEHLAGQFLAGWTNKGGKNTIKSQTDFSCGSVTPFALGWDLFLWEHIMLFRLGWAAQLHGKALGRIDGGRVPEHGQFFCSEWVLPCSVFWYGQQHIPGRSREHTQLLSKAQSRLRHLTAAELKRRQSSGDELIVAFQYLKGTYKQEGNQHFTQVDSDGTRGNGFKVKKGDLD